MNFTKSIMLATAFCSLTTIGSATTFVTPTSTTGTFDVTGTFGDDSKSALSGWFDITNGQITSADMTITGIAGDFTLEPNGGGYYNDGTWENVELDDNGATLNLSLLLPKGVNSLANYNGGALCTASGNCGEIASSLIPATRINLNVNHGGNHGSDDDNDPVLLSSGSVAPEPGSTMLLGAGLTALAVAFRKRFAK